ncbi:MAG: glycosyltransferase family 2 protein [Patescibacteria group bacterium]|nr:glycosyltransferase family 2 protein [Patescibacteria group bacterium]
MPEKFGQYGKHRFWEMIPGILVWTTFLLAILASFFAPTIAVIFIIVFDLYWTLRVIYYIIHMSAAYATYKKTIKLNWLKELKKIKDWQKIHHVVMLPTYKEDVSIIRDALQSIVDAKYDNEHFIIVIGGEEGDKENFAKYQKIIQKEFEGVFQHLMFTLHPRGLQGEIPGKGSNMNWMAHKLEPVLRKMGIGDENIIVSAFDVDTIPHQQYFALLAYTYLTTEDPTHSSYQPVVLFSNNIWSSKAPVRISAFGTTFWLLSELIRPERLWTFSSHSMPWKMLKDVGFWETDLVSEDSRIFMQAFIHYEGHYRVTPIFLPVHMDAVSGIGYWDSLKALYKQQRRWAWGVEHLPYMLEKFGEHPKISKKLKRKYLFNHLEGMYTWATAPLLIFVLGYLPFFVVRDESTALIANSPFTLQFMMQIATVGVFASGIMSFFFLPRRPQEVKPWNWLIIILQWALLPVTFVIFGAFPAIDAQTRFMLGKYLGFNVTKKNR